MQLKFKMILRLNIFLLILSFLFSCSIWQERSTDAPVVELRYKYTAIGYAAISLQHGSTHQQKMLNAIKASKMDAYLELSEHLNGVLMDSSADIDNMTLQTGLTSTRSRGLVKGAKVTKTYHEGDLYITELEIEMNLSQSKSTKNTGYYDSTRNYENGNQVAF